MGKLSKKEEEEEEEQNFSFLVKGLSLSLSQIQSCNNNNKKTDNRYGRRNTNTRIMSLVSTAWTKPCYGKSFSPDLDSVIHRQRKL